MKTRVTGMIAMTAVGYLLTVAAPEAFHEWERYSEVTEPIYAPVSQIHVTRGDGFLMWTGVSKKLRNCNVIPGSPVTLTGHWRDVSGNVNPRAYPATRPSGEVVGGSPIVSAGGGFVVGPWIIHDEPEAITRMVTVSSFVHCRFPSGIERFAEIGPVVVE